MRIPSFLISFQQTMTKKLNVVMERYPVVQKAVVSLTDYGQTLYQFLLKNATHQTVTQGLGQGVKFFTKALSRSGKDFVAPGWRRDLGYAVIASLSIWGIIFFFQANAQGFKVFRYMQF